MLEWNERGNKVRMVECPCGEDLSDTKPAIHFEQDHTAADFGLGRGRPGGDVDAQARPTRPEGTVQQPLSAFVDGAGRSEEVSRA